MGKYIVEVAYTITYVKTFEVDASNQQEAIDKAEQEAYDTDMRTGSAGTPEVEGEIMEAPEDRGECPECGSKLKVEMLECADETSLEEGPRHCECGWHE
jgi:hypothetical protein